MEVLGYSKKEIVHKNYLSLKYEGTETSLMILNQNQNFLEIFLEKYKQNFGFVLENRKIIIDYIRVRSEAFLSSSDQDEDISCLLKIKFPSFFIFILKKKRF